MRCSAATLPVPDVKVCFAAAALLLNVLGALAGVRIVHVVDWGGFDPRHLCSFLVYSQQLACTRFGTCSLRL